MASTTRLFAAAVFALGTGLGLAGCGPRTIHVDQIAKIEVRNLTAAEKMMEGDEVKSLLEGATCQEGNSNWQGGYPATIYLHNGRSMETDGFSYDEPILRISRKQWCTLGQAQWKKVFGAANPP